MGLHIIVRKSLFLKDFQPRDFYKSSSYKRRCNNVFKKKKHVCPWKGVTSMRFRQGGATIQEEMEVIT